MNTALEQLKVILNENGFQYISDGDEISMRIARDTFFNEKYSRKLLPFFNLHKNQFIHTGSMNIEGEINNSVVVKQSFYAR